MFSRLSTAVASTRDAADRFVVLDGAEGPPAIMGIIVEAIGDVADRSSSCRLGSLLFGLLVLLLIGDGNQYDVTDVMIGRYMLAD